MFLQIGLSLECRLAIHVKELMIVLTRCAQAELPLPVPRQAGIDECQKPFPKAWSRASEHDGLPRTGGVVFLISHF